MVVEPRKYSTGTKGRLKMHGDKCREFIHANAPGFSLANEFIASVDPDHEDRVWQRFQSPSDTLPELLEWLGGEVVKPGREGVPGLPQGILPASKLPVSPPVEDALQKTRAWMAGAGGRTLLEKLAPTDAAEAALAKFREFLGPRGTAR